MQTFLGEPHPRGGGVQGRAASSAYQAAMVDKKTAQTPTADSPGLGVYSVETIAATVGWREVEVVSCGG